MHAAFLDSDLADALEIFTAPIILGGTAHNAVDALSATSLAKSPRFTRTSVRQIGPDLLESCVRKA